jgi:hypothetical protein
MAFIFDFCRRGRRLKSSRAARPDELAAQNDYNGQVTWRRITEVVSQRVDTPPSARTTDDTNFHSAAGSGSRPLPEFIVDNRFSREQSASGG